MSNPNTEKTAFTEDQVRELVAQAVADALAKRAEGEEKKRRETAAFLVAMLDEKPGDCKRADAPGEVGVVTKDGTTAMAPMDNPSFYAKRFTAGARNKARSFRENELRLFGDMELLRIEGVKSIVTPDDAGE